MAKSSLVDVREHGDTARHFMPGSVLNRVLLEAPYYARCSDNKTAAKVLPRQYALRYPYMQVNSRDKVSWLVFDLDHENVHIWEDMGLPEPNMIVARRERDGAGERDGTAHLYYAITPVCTSAKAHARPIEYMKAVYLNMAEGLKADPHYHSGPVAKTPGHPWWRTHELHSRVYDLGDLAKFLDMKREWRSTSTASNHAPHSRHCQLFEVVRHYAYSIVNEAKAGGGYEHFVAVLEAYAQNSMARVLRVSGSSEGDLRWSSIKATVKSVARWTWEKYTGTGGVHRGVMQLDPSLPLSERQRLAAERTHDVRATATESRIRAACRNLQALGRPLLQTAIAKAAQLSRQTVAAYKHVLEEVAASPSSVTPLRERAEAAVARVKDAVHQITAALAPPVDAAKVGGFGAGFPRSSSDPCP